MICTESEAKTKWCPEIKILLAPPSYEGGSAFIMTNRFGDSSYNCIASGCAQWEWSQFEENKGYCGKTRKAGITSLL